MSFLLTELQENVHSGREPGALAALQTSQDMVGDLLDVGRTGQRSGPWALLRSALCPGWMSVKILTPAGNCAFPGTWMEGWSEYRILRCSRMGSMALGSQPGSEPTSVLTVPGALLMPGAT